MFGWGIFIGERLWRPWNYPKLPEQRQTKSFPSLNSFRGFIVLTWILIAHNQINPRDFRLRDFMIPFSDKLLSPWKSTFTTQTALHKQAGRLRLAAKGFWTEVEAKECQGKARVTQSWLRGKWKNLSSPILCRQMQRLTAKLTRCVAWGCLFSPSHSCSCRLVSPFSKSRK